MPPRRDGRTGARACGACGACRVWAPPPLTPRGACCALRRAQVRHAELDAEEVPAGYLVSGSGAPSASGGGPQEQASAPAAEPPALGSKRKLDATLEGAAADKRPKGGGSASEAAHVGDGGEDDAICLSD